MPFPDVTFPPGTTHEDLVNKLQRFFNSAMPYLRRLGIVAPSGSTVDHGLLNGLADDDHTQYLNTARHTALDGDHVTNGDSHNHSGGDGAALDYGDILNTPASTVISGLDADKPAPTGSGVFYWATDTEKLYFDPPL